jgi:hydroxymethylglutaryl-CoA synthase
MAGIVSTGIHIPIYRLSRDDIAKMWGGRSGGGEKAVASYDEDSLTMSVAAALDCMKQSEQQADGLFFATTTSPYKEKQAATTIATAADFPKASRTADFTGSLRAGTIAMSSALDAVKSGSAKNILVTAADNRMAAANSKREQEFGDGAVALMIGSDNVLASIDGSYSIFDEIYDIWRTDEDDLVRSGDERFATTQGYLPVMQEAMSGLMKKHGLKPADFAKVVYYAPDAKSHANLAKSLGFEPKTQVQDPLYSVVGNTGTASSLMMLVAALDEVKPGDKILLASYGNGSDAFVLNVTENINKIKNRPKIADRLARKLPLSYEKYIGWRNLMPIEGVRLPERTAPSIPALFRERRGVLALYGVKCRQCGTPQYPVTRICAVCQAKDDFDDYKFSDKRGKLFTYAIDRLALTPSPPGINGVIDFDDGGRILCDITDCDINEVKIGLPMEMTFRKIFESSGITSYYWKGKPIL